MNGFKDRSIPLYYQLENVLREKINSGEVGPGDPFPTEDQLVHAYKVSRITVRQALAAMESDGLIIRRRGKGSFVAEQPIQIEPMKLTGMIEDILARVGRMTTKIVNFGFVHPPRRVGDILKLREAAKVLRAERIRLMKGSPISYTLSYVPPDIGKKLTIRDLSSLPLIDVLEQKCKINIAKGKQIIEATIADSRMASLLDVMTGAPLLKIERTIFDAKDRPVEFLSILYRSDRYHYTVDLIRKRTQRRPRWVPIKE